jgi:hypothetical protein
MFWSDPTIFVIILMGFDEWRQLFGGREKPVKGWSGTCKKNAVDSHT